MHISYESADDTATVGDQDYQETTGTVTIPAGETQATISVAVIGDRKIEPDETFFVVLTDVENATTVGPGGSRLGVGTIRNDDLLIDLDIDSFNNRGLLLPLGTDEEDELEDDPSLPGKVILANRLDSTGNGRPDFADFGQGESQRFVPIVVTLDPSVRLDRARLRFTYTAANPSSVSSSGGTFPIWDPGSTAPIRIWRRDGDRYRAPNQYYVFPDTAYSVSGLFPRGSRSVTLYVEGINESARGDVRIIAELDPEGTGTFAPENSDAVRASVGTVQIVYTDVTGLTGIGNTPPPGTSRVFLETSSRTGSPPTG